MKGKRITIAGHEFIQVLTSDLLPRPAPGSPTEAIIRYRPEDGFLDFPPCRWRRFEATLPSEGGHRLASAGLAKHELRDGGKGKGFSAASLRVFDETEWFIECMSVLEAHGWIDRNGPIAASLLSQINEVEGEQALEEAKQRDGDSWEYRMLEIASIHFAEPFSRLWYAANLMSLYYWHQDDLKFGYLWSEYRIRMEHEADAVRGRRLAESSAAGSKARERERARQKSKVLAEMERLSNAGHSVRRAAELACKAGFGRSAEANRKAFYRAQGQKSRE